MSHLTRSRLYLLAILAVCLAATSRAGTPALQRDVLDARLFPMSVGQRWAYAFGDGEVAFEVLRTEQRLGTKVYFVRRTIDETHVEFVLAVEPHGVYLHQEGDKEFSPPLRQFAFFARTGDEWKWRGTAGDRRERQQFEHLGLRKVTVPAGTYTAVSVYQHNPETGEHATFWLAEGVGVVKVSGKTELTPDDPASGPILFEWKLKSFDKPEARTHENWFSGEH